MDNFVRTLRGEIVLGPFAYQMTRPAAQPGSGQHTTFRFLFSTALVALITLSMSACGGGGAQTLVRSSASANQTPTIQFVASPKSGTAPLVVTADTTGSADPDGSIASRSINFGDGTIVNNQMSATHTYKAAGNYTMTATVTDNSGASAGSTLAVIVTAAPNQPPVAQLTVVPTSGAAPLLITADTAGSSDLNGTIISRSINFGDGTTVTNQVSATHTYTAGGTYTVTATVTDNDGASGTATKVVTVSVAGNLPPVAQLTVTPASGTAPLSVTADTTGSSDPDGTIASRSIAFGDGTTINNQISAAHTYSSAGTYTVTATVTDNGGISSSVAKTVTVTAANQPPVAQLAVTPASGVAPLGVTADTSGSSDPDGSIAARSINFGDGTTVNNQVSATHTYTTAGSFTITATVTDNSGASGSATKIISVAANLPPVAVLAVTPTSGTIPLQVSAATTGSSDPDGTIASTVIAWGDGSQTNAATGSHTYSSIGTFTVTATVTDNAGASASSTQSVTATASSGGGGSAQWPTPVGLPTPSFGLNETAPASPSPWDSTHTVNGLYRFYYICPNCAGATDTSNPYGYPGSPRASIPNVTGPAVVAIATNAGANVNTSLDGATYSGTASAPVFVRSFDAANPTTLTQPITVSAGTHYLIVENLRFSPSSGTDTNWGFFILEGSDHVVFRNNEVIGSTTSNSTGFGLGQWSYTGSAWVDNAVVVNNHIHQQYDINAAGDPDDHCITVNGSVRETYIWYNELDHCAGDGIQLEAQHTRGAQFIHHVYIGKNYSHHNRQSGFWVKHVSDVIFSQNKADNVWGNAANGDPGICYGGQYSPVRSWFLYNECSNANIALAVSSDDGDPLQDMYFVGNWVHDLNAISTGVYDSGGIRCQSQKSVYFVNNLFYKINRNLNFVPGCATGGPIVFNANLVSRASGDTSHYDLYTEGGVTMTFANNIFSATPRFTDSSGTWTTCSGLSNVGTTTGCSTTQPSFVNAAGLDFHLQAGSAGIDAFTAKDAVYTIFSNLYGRSIEFDAGGATRPQGAGWDIGPYER